MSAKCYRHHDGDVNHASCRSHICIIWYFSQLPLILFNQKCLNFCPFLNERKRKWNRCKQHVWCHHFYCHHPSFKVQFTWSWLITKYIVLKQRTNTRNMYKNIEDLYVFRNKFDIYVQTSSSSEALLFCFLIPFLFHPF